MITTVYNLKDFEEKTDFSYDIYYSWESENIGKSFPVVEIREQVYGVPTGGRGLVVYDSAVRISMMTLIATQTGVDPMASMNEAIESTTSEFVDAVVMMAKYHSCRAIPGTLALSPFETLEQRLESLERRLDMYENNDANIMSCLEDRLDCLEARVRAVNRYCGDGGVNE